MTKVSVIVATYCSGDGLDRVLRSLDGQTMPQADFETVFVDDGSPDDTHARLLRFASQRANMRVTAIENSGWPSRPRNVGLAMARGEYVVFMDHDDELYPEALAVASRFAEEHRADVVNTKESTTHGWFWGFETLLEDVLPGTSRRPELLMPMRPHKLYRRDLLNEHGIRFREGRRVIYEDVYFNLEVLARAERIGVLASQPFYRWVSTGSNNSSSYAADPREAWHAVRQMFRMVRELDLDDAQRDRLVRHIYQLRVLNIMLGTNLLRRPEAWVRDVLETAPTVVDEFVPARFDSELDGRMRPRAHLLRSGRTDMLPAAAALDVGVTAHLVALRVGWTDRGVLQIDGTGSWHGAAGSPLGLVERQGRLLRDVPAQLRDALPDDVLDLTRAVRQAEATATVKGRHSSLDWPVPTSHRVTAGGRGAARDVVVEVEAQVPVADAAFGRPLPDEVWDVGCRLALAGYVSHRAVRYDGPARAALVDGRQMVAYADKKGRLLLDVGGHRRGLLDATRPVVPEGHTRRASLFGGRLTIPVAGLVVVGESRLPLRVRLRPAAGGEPLDFAAALVADDRGARLETVVRPRPGSYWLLVVERVAGTDRVWDTNIMLSCGRARRLRARRVPARRRRGRRMWDTDETG